MGDIRMATTAIFVVEQNEQTTEKKFDFGCRYQVTKIEQDTITGDCNIFFQDGGAVYGVPRTAFDVYGLTVIDITQEPLQETLPETHDE